ncbi:MAG: VOC family protein [Actinobacteria bacterium]|nr:VOC family protein [Actinomycetota bacterium]
MTELDDAWDGERRVVQEGLDEFCTSPNYRAPDQFAGDAIARADHYLDEWANHGQPPSSDLDQRRLRSFRKGPIAAFSLVALDCPDPLALAEFYISFAGGRIRTESSEHQWVRVRMPGGVDLGFQGDPDYVAPDWPDGGPQQAHLDFDVTDLDDAEAALLRIGAAKASVQPSPDDWRVMLDPAGHPFCIVLVP